MTRLAASGLLKPLGETEALLTDPSLRESRDGCIYILVEVDGPPGVEASEVLGERCLGDIEGEGVRSASPEGGEAPC